MRRLRSTLIALASLGCLIWAAARQEGPTAAEGDEKPPPITTRDGPRYWKGNLHTHSLWSDGDDYPEMIADWYKRHGYQFLALTDHNVLADGQRWVDEGRKGSSLQKYVDRFGEAWVERREVKGKFQVRLKPLAEFRSVLEEPGRFLLVPGEEVTHRFAKLPVHVNAINLRDVLQPVDGGSVGETLTVNMRAIAEQRRRTGRRMIASLNHPNFQWGVRAEDMVLSDELRFFEIYNGHPGVRNYGDADHASTERVWDIVLALRLGKHRLGVVYGLATDDAHGYHAFGVGKVNPGRGWVMVRAPYLSAEAVVRGLEAGDFYASTGVVLDEVRANAREVALTVHSEPGVTYTTQFIATLRDAPLDSTPRLDADGNPLNVTREYSPAIGKVVAESDGLTPRYRFTGAELYVRAKVTSTKPHPNPYAAGDVEVAWTQPVVPGASR